MTQIRIGESFYELPDEQWEEWVRRGRVPPDAWVRSQTWTNGVWRLADSLEVFHLYRPRGGSRAPQAPPVPGLLATIFPRKGVSVTETILALNLVVSGALLFLWRSEYGERLWWLSGFLRHFVDSGFGFFAAIIPMFLHASPSHLLFNMFGLAASGSVTEYFYGRGKMLLCYILTGYAGAAVSLALRPKPLLSVGASGAIFGLYGLALLFLLRTRKRFHPRLRRKTVRIYLPIAVLAIVPAIFGGDFYTHLGGFLAGCILGVILEPGPRLGPYLEPDPPSDSEGNDDRPAPIL